MAFPVSDAFTGTNGDALSTYDGASWATFDDHYIQTNAAGSDRNIGNPGASRSLLESATADVEVSVDVLDLGSIGKNGPAARMGTAATRQDYYGVYCGASGGGLMELISDVGGSIGTLSTASTDPTGSTVKLECIGTTITVYIDGSTTGAPAAQTDTDQTTGFGGLVAYSRDASCRVDNWVWDEASAAADEKAPRQQLPAMQPRGQQIARLRI